MKNFIFNNSWFDKKYAKLGAIRHPTFRAALNIFVQNSGSTIVETGCCRMPDDWGAGLSSVLLSDVCHKMDKNLFTVDLSSQNMDMCKLLTKDFAESITNKALFISFPYGRPGLYPNEYSNIHKDMLVKMDQYWKDKMGTDSEICFYFFYNENSVLGRPWKMISIIEASQIEMNMNVGQCFCIVEARRNEVGEKI